MAENGQIKSLVFKTKDSQCNARLPMKVEIVGPGGSRLAFIFRPGTSSFYSSLIEKSNQ
jgi:hypothetical protein